MKKETPKSTTAELGAVLYPLVDRVTLLEQWKHDQELAKSAVAEYVKSQPKQSPRSEQILTKDLIKIIVTALGIIGALVALLTQLHGAPK